MRVDQCKVEGFQRLFSEKGFSSIEKYKVYDKIHVIFEVPFNSKFIRYVGLFSGLCRLKLGRYKLYHDKFSRLKLCRDKFSRLKQGLLKFIG
jgi:hypothetical protein